MKLLPQFTSPARNPASLVTCLPPTLTAAPQLRTSGLAHPPWLQAQAAAAPRTASRYLLVCAHSFHGNAGAEKALCWMLT